MASDEIWMGQALELARRGEGHVEPNPMVGCVLVRDGSVCGEGWHEKYGAAHAEVNALAVAGERARGATAYVTLEPCCHTGNTPPCTEALIQAGIVRVVVGHVDPFPAVDGGGIDRLRRAGVEVQTGVLGNDVFQLLCPYLKLTRTSRPWVIAKWAMTLDGHIATRAGDSKWISSERSREIAHRLRGRVDAIAVGRRTAQLDDPRLTARPPGPRQAVRVVVDPGAKLAPASQLAQTASDVPVVLFAGPTGAATQIEALRAKGIDVVALESTDAAEFVEQMLSELGRRRMTNLLVEGGGELLGSLLDSRQIDEAHVFIAPKLIGGRSAPSPMAGRGLETIAESLALDAVSIQECGRDVYIHGRVTQSDFLTQWHNVTKN